MELSELINQAEQALVAKGLVAETEMPPWMPCTMSSWQFEQGTRPTTQPDGSVNYHKWIIRMNNNSPLDWCSIISNRGLKEGIHYWEINIVITTDNFMFGICHPPQGINDLSIHNEKDTGLWNHLGNKSSIILNKYSSGWHINRPTGELHRYGSSNYASDTLIPKLSDFSGSRFGLLLDLVKHQLKLFFFAPNNASNKPDHELILVNSLMKGMEYFPIFSVRGTTTVMEVTIDGNPPDTVKQYQEEVKRLLRIISQLDMKIKVIKDLALNEREQHLENYQRLVTLVAQLTARLSN